MVSTKRDLINALLLLFFCCFAYYESSLISERNLGKTEADFFPNIVIIVLAILSLCLLVKSIYGMVRAKDYHFKFSFRNLLQENKKVILTFAIFGLYVLLLDYIGYFLSSILFLFTLYLLLSNNKQKLWAVLLGMVAFTLVLYVVFQNGLSVFLPTGQLF
ncbi:tripartite tricarboxylate transporter TctB family protein [Halobacillus shinanisalinarum]|uniref:Tripartite tricarboxylate transporter TctB family protein n=1 Tax=Halobacillus shinanisalinarum TaxID=2932258 RepID=A0ABY4GX24_9BACI|nr:tripartite tricarboxylate transporter TctB family protein [Halobacillus shinanisalinarum]UOQ92270.1 tripartite tricarboxylate transporter TctB family protein [Halobacillus shinanisalinarum]